MSELTNASDADIDDAVQHAQPLVLHGLLHQLTGDEDLLGLNPGGGAKFDTGSDTTNTDDEQKIKAKAAEFLKRFRDAGEPALDIGPIDRLRQSLSLTAAYDIPPGDLDIWLEELALDRWARGVEWKAGAAPAARSGFKVAVIGTGISGLNVAVQLKRAGIPFVVFEKNADVGGSWFENRYPGARVDTASRGYTHLFGYDFPFTHGYSPRDVNLAYFRWVVDEFGIREDIQFETEVEAMVWDDTAQVWGLTTRTASGSQTATFNAVISCVGFLSRPKLPEIEGIETFEGVACHTATWPDEFDVAGKRIAVVGSAASGYQTTPVIAKSAAQTFVFQRTPNWCFEDKAYVKELAPQVGWLERNFPFYGNFVRFRIASTYNPALIKSALHIDPDHVDPDSVNLGNKAIRDACVGFIRRKLGARPDLVEKMTPNSPPMASRPIRVDADDSIYDALMRDDVSLVTDGIERITPHGIVAGGKQYDVDAIVFATGFRANDYLWPMDVRGRDGVKIQDVWKVDGPRAYLGAMVPGFPNLFMCYGPNTNNFGGFTVVDLLEMVAQFALRCIAGLIEQGAHSVDVSEDAYWRFARILDAEDSKMVYMDPRATNYYRNEQGRSSVNGPIDIRRMYRWLHDPAGNDAGPRDDGLSPRFGEDLIVA
ncbi:flavin-containing monooxygenase [Sphingomonas solaris]|uniref:Trimethylamine monooxygenase n=1 Tax=Alterirhizorhabdus solaris TaxID=2529389 RepID=A0A558R8M7_9SPHN|nr:NAD(P)/FAD-dependent oxidoreductase [Sphingomonas solaris]TVV75750.1 NAD(P)/FAD-dependent oxidoreductase [Sphingomonas solaris]